MRDYFANTKTDHNNNEKLSQHDMAENLNEENKEYIAREMEVLRINRQPQMDVYRANYADKLFLERTVLNEEDDIPLTQEEMDAINKFWKPYSFAYKNNPEIQRVFSRMSGKFDPSYISWGVQYNLLPSFWECKQLRPWTHKHYIAWFFPEMPKPRTYVIKEWGGFFNEQREFISSEEALDICWDVIQKEEEIIVKPSVGVGGSGIQIVRKGISKDELREVLSQYSGYLCQQVIKNHPSYKTSEALNTLRITTLYHNGEFYWVASILRMAFTNDAVDNWHAGGLACPVNEDGICADFAVSMEGKRFYSHPSGVQFAGRKLFNYEKAHQLALELHKKLPLVKYLAWDIAIGEDGEPVVIEFGNPGDSVITQACGFNTYGCQEFSKDALDYCFRTFYYSRAVFDWNYREYSRNITLEKYCGFDSIIRIPEFINGKKVTYVHKNAIMGSSYEEIHVPMGVRLENGAIKQSDVKIVYY